MEGLFREVTHIPPIAGDLSNAPSPRTLTSSGDFRNYLEIIPPYWIYLGEDAGTETRKSARVPRVTQVVTSSAPASHLNLAHPPINFGNDRIN
jgi:hypothetical protein